MKSKLTSEQLSNIIHLYQTTELDKSDLGKMFHLNPTSIGYWLKKYNIPIKKRITDKYRKHSFDISFFLNESPKSAYLFGFALGDGCLIQNKQRNQYQLSFQVDNKDEYILEQFCEWTNCPKVAIGHTKSGLSQLRFNSKKLFGEYNFTKWGLIPNKTYEGIIPNIPEHLVRPFIIGLIDADGSISWRSPNNRICLTCSKPIIEWYISTLRFLGFSGSITHINVPNKSWARANITKQKDIISVSKLLEIENYPYFMERKWNKIPK